MAMPEYLEPEPLEFRDFSGGMTDHVLQGDKTRYELAQNFQITIDRKLYQRDGTVIFDSTGYNLNGAVSRVTTLQPIINETILLAGTQRDVYLQTPSTGAWSAVKGPSGNEALGAGDSYSQFTSAEFQRQLYFTNDASPLPGKIFRDSSNVWQVRTAGMPKQSWAPNYSTSGLLAKCIALANALRGSMLLHYADAAGVLTGTSTIFQHKYQDKVSGCYLATQTFIGPDPEQAPVPPPTPAPDATDQATLLTLCAALSLSYEHHRNDLAGPNPTTGAGGKLYHQDIVIQPVGAGTGAATSALGINAKLVQSGAPTTVAGAAALLDDLAQKWYWHQFSPFSHSPTNDIAQMNRYPLSVSKVGTIYDTTTVQVTPNYGDFIALSLWLKNAWNNHVSNTDSTNFNMHSQIGLYGPVTLPDPFDYDSAALTVFWCRWLYAAVHAPDANFGVHTGVTFDTTAGSVNLTNVKGTASGLAITLPVDSWILTTGLIFNDANNLNRKASRVVSSGLGTAVLTRAATSSIAGNLGQFSGSWLHGSYLNSTLVDSTASGQTASELLSTATGSIGVSLKDWLLLAAEFTFSFGAHLANGVTHKQSNSFTNEIQGVSPVNGNPFFIPSAVRLAYASFYKYTYTVEPNGLIYSNEGPPVFSNSVDTCPSYPVGTLIKSQNSLFYTDTVTTQENSCATVQAIPSLANTSQTNYDTDAAVPDPSQPNLTPTLSTDLYRTTDGGSTFFLLVRQANGVLLYTDKTSDTLSRPGESPLNLKQQMYTTGGVVANDPPPRAKFVHALNGYFYYGAITDSGQFFPQRIRQSNGSQPDSCPATFFDDVEDELVGLTSTRSNLISICRASVYRHSGLFTSNGQGFMSHERVSDAMGGLNAKSIVRTEVGVFYAGTDGFYYTDGYQTIKISLDLDTTYRALTKRDGQKSRIYGAYDKLTRRIWWSLTSNESAVENDVFFTFYLDYGIKPSGVFTTAKTDASWMPSSVAFFQGRMIVGDSRGYLFKSDPFTKTDPKIDTTTSPGNWLTQYMPWRFKSCALDFGTTFKRKWVTKIHSIGQNVGNVSLQINSINDNNAGSGGIKPLAPIQYLANFMWGDSRFTWGDSSCVWKYAGKMDVFRRFPTGAIRSGFKQIEYVPGNFGVYRSDDYPPYCFATVDSAAKTATIQTPSGFTSILWPLDVVDYFIAFDTDKYAKTYLITALDVTSKIITYSDAGGTSTNNAGAKWQISGYKRNQRVAITAFDVHYSFLEDDNRAYPGNNQPGGLGVNT